MSYFDIFNWGRSPADAGASGTPSMGFDPAAMQKMQNDMRRMMAMQAISSGAQQFGSGLSQVQGGPPVQGGGGGYSNPMSMMLPMLQMQNMGMVAQKRAEDMAKEKQQAQAFYGQYAPEAGGKPWVNPDKVEVAQAGGMAPGEAIRSSTDYGGGLVNRLPPELQPVARALGPEKGSAFVGSLMAQQMKPKELPGAVQEYEYAVSKGYKGDFESWKKVAQNGGQEQFGNTPIWGTDDKGNPVLMQPSNRGGVRQVQLPPGVTPQRGQTSRVDLGTEWGILDANGSFIGRVPKDVAGAAREKELGEAAGKAQVNLPGAEANATYMLELLDKVTTKEESGARKNHPGFETVVGMPGATGVLSKIGLAPGTDAASFRELMDQIGGKQFLEAFESLKGGGQITQVEGEKATKAIARMGTAQKEGDFLDAVDEFKDIVRKGLNRAKMKAGSTPAAPSGSWSIRPRS